MKSWRNSNSHEWEINKQTNKKIQTKNPNKNQSQEEIANLLLLKSKVFWAFIITLLLIFYATCAKFASKNMFQISLLWLLWASNLPSKSSNIDWSVSSIQNLYKNPIRDWFFWNRWVAVKRILRTCTPQTRKLIADFNS